MADIDDVMRKIEKCMALANDTRGDPNTASIALAQAQKLMEAYNVTHTDMLLNTIQMTDVRSKVSVKNPSTWEANVMFHICSAFGCRPFWKEGGPEPTNKGYWMIVGPKLYVPICLYSWDVTCRALLKSRTDFVAKLRQHPVLCDLPRGQKSAMADDFCIGWGYAVRKKITAMADPDGRIAAIHQAFNDKHGGNLQKQQLNDRGNNELTAMALGASAASDFNINRPMDQRAGSQPLKIGR